MAAFCTLSDWVDNEEICRNVIYIQFTLSKKTCQCKFLLVTKFYHLPNPHQQAPQCVLQSSKMCSLTLLVQMTQHGTEPLGGPKVDQTTSHVVQCLQRNFHMKGVYDNSNDTGTNDP